MPGADAKRKLRRVMKTAAWTAGALVRPKPWVNRILTYHSVGARKHEMNVPPPVFREQMQWLAGHLPVISLAQAAQGLPGIAITFDDGYADNLTGAAPVLHELGLPATVFIVAGAMGGFLPHDEPCTECRLLTWEEARRLEDFSIDVGSHGMTHRRLSGLTGQEAYAEIAGSRQSIAGALGRPPAFFAYPFGTSRDYSPRILGLVEDAGYMGGVSNRYGPNQDPLDCFKMRRINIDQSDTMADFQNKIGGRLDLLSLKESVGGLLMRRVINKMTK